MSARWEAARRVLVVAVCVATLACVAPKSADVDRLLSALHDPHWQARAAAADELGRANLSRAIPDVRAALDDDSGEVRAAAATALGRLGARTALPDIRTLIRDDANRHVVLHALAAFSVLAGHDDPERQRDIDMLIERVSDDRKDVSASARQVLFVLAGRKALAETIRRELHDDWDVARVHGSRMALALDLRELRGWAHEMVRDTSPYVRANAYAAIGRKNQRSDLALLLRGLEDPDSAARAQAAAGLQKLDRPAALPALQRAAGADPAEDVRLTAARAIASITGIPGSALPALWHFERIDDRLALGGDGLCTLTRTFTLVIDGSPEPTRQLKILLPRGFASVDRVADAQGNPLNFELGWVDDLRQVVLEVPPIERGEPATFTVVASSPHLVSSLSADEAVISYAPGPFQARVQTLRVELEGPAGQTASLNRTGVAPGDARDVVLRAAIPATGLSLHDAPARSYTRHRDWTTLAVVIASILGGLAAMLVALRRRLKERADRVLLVATLTTGALLFLTPILLEDNLPYYAWARSAVLDGDLDRLNEFTEFNQTQAYAPDHREVQDPILAPLFDAPFITAAHGLTRIANVASPAHAPNGFSFPYLFLTALGDFFAVLVGCLACFSLVERRIGARYALFGVLAVVGGTNLVLFAYAWTGGSFQPSFLLFAIFLNHWDKTREARTRGDWFTAGVLLGLLAMTRTLNLGFALIPFLDWLHATAVRVRKAGLSGLVSEVGLGAVLTSGMLVGYAPQLLVQRLVDQAFFVDAYGVSSGRFAGLRDNIGAVFVAPRNGLFLAMPVLALAFLGLVALFRYDRRLGTVLTATLAAQLLVIGSYEMYWGRFLYGTPYLVPCTPIFCLGMASLMRTVESRWRRLGPALLWGATVLCAARNGWCVLMILAQKMVGPSRVRMSLPDVVHALLLPERKLDVDVLRPATEFGCLLRELVGGLRAWDLGRLLGALGWASLVILPVVLAYPAAARIRRFSARVSRTALLRIAVPAIVLVWLATMGWIATLARHTDLDYDYEIESRQTWLRALAVKRLEPGQSYTVKFHLANPPDRFSLITFIDGAVDIPQGERVATVEFVGDAAGPPIELRAGVDTADFEVDRPESRRVRAHTAPLDRACFSWRVSDDSSLFYTARAYRSVFTLAAGTRPTGIRVTSTLTHGAIDVLVGTAREHKLTNDPSRRRFFPADR